MPIPPSASSLAPGTWTPIAINIPATPPANTYSVELAPPAGFVRVQVE